MESNGLYVRLPTDLGGKTELEETGECETLCKFVFLPTLRGRQKHRDRVNATKPESNAPERFEGIHSQRLSARQHKDSIPNGNSSYSNIPTDARLIDA
jgi:hypothetical protein